MRKISGSISCSENRAIEPNAVVIVSVVDVSLACGPSLTVGEREYTNLTQFPFSYEVEYNDGTVNERYRGDLALAIRIEVDGKLKFVNDTRFHLRDYETNAFLDNLDAFVIPV